MHSLKWKKFNSFIDVCEDGTIKSHSKVIKGEICNNGYRRVHVSNNGKDCKFLVHRIVAETFIPNPKNLPCVNHKDGNKLNCSVDNLEWCSYGENLSHAFRTGLRNCKGESNTRHKLTKSDVLEIRKRYVKGKHSENNSYGLGIHYGVSPKTIQNIVKRKSWTHV